MAHSSKSLLPAKSMPAQPPATPPSSLARPIFSAQKSTMESLVAAACAGPPARRTALRFSRSVRKPSGLLPKHLHHSTPCAFAPVSTNRFSRGPSNNWRSIPPASFSVSAFPRAAFSPANTNLSAPPRTQFPLPAKNDVLTHLQNDRLGITASLGRPVFTSPVRAHVCPQLL